MDVIGHYDIAAHRPCVGLSPCAPQCFVSLRARLPCFTALVQTVTKTIVG